MGRLIVRGWAAGRLAARAATISVAGAIQERLSMAFPRPWISAGLAGLLAFFMAAARGDDSGTRPLDLYFIDVMGGAATLIVTPEKESMLIDSGWPGFDDRDPRRIVHVLRELAGCDHLDHLVTTHWHMDHYGGVAGLAKYVAINHFWDRGLPDDHDPELDFPDGPAAGEPLGIAYRESSKGKRKALKAGDSIPLRGKLAALVVASGGKVRHEAATVPLNPVCTESSADRPIDTSDNARSLAIKFQYGEFDFLDCGDLTWNVERALVCPQNSLGIIDLYQVTHHGMDTSNNPLLVRSIRPTVTIMNNGPTKGGAPATVKLLRSIPSIQAAYQLHRNAQTGAEENTHPELIANSDKAGGQFIHVSVNADGAKFQVQIGPDGPMREFASR
jgi:beta-lactamase superfamily II metal-dependent hydrolase